MSLASDKSGTTVTVVYVALAESHTTTKGQRKAEEMQMQMQEGAWNSSGKQAMGVVWLVVWLVVIVAKQQQQQQQTKRGRERNAQDGEKMTERSQSLQLLREVVV